MKQMFVIMLVGCTLAGCQSALQETTPINDLSADQIIEMTNDQIHALPEIALDAAIAKLNLTTTEEDIETAATNIQATNSKWPNYEYTRYVATLIAYPNYKKNYYKTYEGPNWNDNGCSVPWPKSIPQVSWIWDDNACRHHDFGYRNMAQYGQGRNENVRRAIDDRFLSNMKLKCDKYYDGILNTAQRWACKADAYIFYGMVRRFGDNHYYQTTQKFP